MKQLHTLVIGDDVRGAVARVVERLESVHAVVARDWHHVADQCLFESSTNPDSSPLVFGPLAFVLKFAASAEVGFGFVMPVAQRSKPWQRSSNWRDDATLELWRVGWAPRAIDRILVPTQDAVIELAIGDVRRIPSVAGQLDGSATS